MESVHDTEASMVNMWDSHVLQTRQEPLQKNKLKTFRYYRCQCHSSIATWQQRIFPLSLVSRDSDACSETWLELALGIMMDWMIRSSHFCRSGPPYFKCSGERPLVFFAHAHANSETFAVTQMNQTLSVYLLWPKDNFLTNFLEL